MLYLKILSQNLYEETEENHEHLSQDRQ